MERIHIAGLALYAYHGCNEEERQMGQLFLLDISLTVDLRNACRSDCLEDTVNYAAVIKCAAAAFTREAVNLIEHAGERTAQAILREFPAVQEVTLRVHKPDAPVALTVSDLSIEMKRRREDLRT